MSHMSYKSDGRTVRLVMDSGTSLRPATEKDLRELGWMPVSESAIEIEELFITKDMLEEIKQEADRLDRSVSWVIRRAWKNYKEKA